MDVVGPREAIESAGMFIMIVVVEAHNAEKLCSFARTDVSSAGADFSRSPRLGRHGEGRQGARPVRRAKIRSTSSTPTMPDTRSKAACACCRPPGRRCVADFFSDTASGCGASDGADHLGMHAVLPRRKRLAKRQRRDSFCFHRAARRLGDLAVLAGIELIIGNFDAAALHLWRRIGCEVEILGSDVKIRPSGLSRPAPHFRADHQQDKEKAERRPIRRRRGARHGRLGRAARSAF